MNTQELVQIETASIITSRGLEYMYQVVINRQDTPAISLDALRELRRLCDCFIAFGERVGDRQEPPADDVRNPS